MNRSLVWGVVCLFCWLPGGLWANPTLPPGCLPSGVPGTTPAPGSVEAPPAAPTVSPGEIGTGAGEAGAGGLASGVPNMIGDFFGVRFRRQVVVPSTVTTQIRSANGQTFFVGTIPSQRLVTIQDVGTGRAAFKITEFESPRPQDRAFLSYNYYYNVAVIGGSVGPKVVASIPLDRDNVLEGVDGGATVPNRQVRIHRQTFGLERTFLDGNASAGLRVPFFQVASSEDSTANLGDISVFFKYVLLGDAMCGDLLTAGFVVTAPTGPTIGTIAGDIRSTLLQPWAGYLVTMGDFYAQGFHSVVIPTDERDTTVLCNDLALGYFLRRHEPCRRVSMAAVALEAHVTTPLNHRGETAPIVIPDLVVLTGAVHLGLGKNALFSFGAATPVTGDRVFDVEAFAQLNFRF